MSWIIAIILYIVGCIVEGALASSMWSWFMVPLGVPAINTAHAIGIAALCSVFFVGKSASSNTEKSDLDKGWQAVAKIVGAFVGNLLLFGIAAIVHCFM